VGVGDGLGVSVSQLGGVGVSVSPPYHWMLAESSQDGVGVGEGVSVSQLGGVGVSVSPPYHWMLAESSQGLGVQLGAGVGVLSVLCCALKSPELSWQGAGVHVGGGGVGVLSNH
jgi:hypothetical protein